MERPLRATEHCRHYSYEKGKSFLDSGPKCAVGLDVSQSVKQCMPEPTSPCSKREDYTDEERAAWKAYTDNRMQMIPVAIRALGGPVALGETRTVDCPHCSGKLTVRRMSNGHAWLQCTTQDCIGPIHFNIDRKAKWPELTR